MKKTKDIPRAQRRWVEVNLSGARFHNVDLTGATIRGATVVDVEIDGLVAGLTVNGVEVSGFVEQELERRHPERRSFRADDPAGFHEGWTAIEALWDATTGRALRLPEERLHERVDGEWSFVETLRHLIMATDGWISRPVLGRKHHYYPAGLPHTDMPRWFVAACEIDLTASPPLEEVLAVRRERQSTVRDLIAGLTQDEIDRRCRGNSAPGYPTDTRKFRVKDCLRTVLKEEWLHRQFAERDLAILAAT